MRFSISFKVKYVWEIKNQTGPKLYILVKVLNFCPITIKVGENNNLKSW